MTTRERPDVKLGDRARDTISGFEGIVIAITNWLNGCRRITIQPEALHDGKPIGNETFDAEQVAKVEAKPAVKPSQTGGPSIPPTRASDPV